MSIQQRDPYARGGSLSASIMLDPNGAVPPELAVQGFTPQIIQDEQQRRQKLENVANKAAVVASSIPPSVNVPSQPTLQASIHYPAPKREQHTPSILHGQQLQPNPTQISSSRYTPHSVSGHSIGHVTNVRPVNPSFVPKQELSTDAKIKMLMTQVESLTKQFDDAQQEIAYLKREFEQIRSLLNNTYSNSNYSGYGSPYYDPYAVSSLTTSRLPVPSSSQPTTPTPYYYSDSSSTSTGHQSN